MEMDFGLELVIRLIKAQKTDHNSMVGNLSRIKEARYLLNQVIRQYAIPEENYYISLKAKELWDRISEDNIWNYYYKDMVPNINGISVPQYVGSEKNSRKTDSCKGFDFRSVFHDEHIISIKEIIKQLDEIPEDELNYQRVKEILDRIVVCRILKEEDRNLPNGRRYSTFFENYEKKYKPNGIVLLEAKDEFLKRNRVDK